MLPRISLRRCFLYLVVVAGFVLVVVNVHQRELWARSLASAEISPPETALPHRTKEHPPPLKVEQEAEDEDEDFRDNGVETDEANVGSKLKVTELDKKAITFLQHNNVGKEIRVDEDGEKQTEDAEYKEEDEEAEEVNEIPVAPTVKTTPAPNPADSLRPWYMTGGRRRPLPAARSRKTGQRVAKLWPQEQPGSDRIANQLMFVPPPSPYTSETRLKKILVFNGLGNWGVKPGRDYFRSSECPVDTCTITANRAEASDSDAILYKDHFVSPGLAKTPKQVWILYFLECPYHTQHVKFNDVFNWTATYRRDSDIVAPYERWAYYDDRIKQKTHLDRNYAANKTKKVAWFVSNCGARNRRLQYAHELQKYISVDIYGACGPMKCPRSTANACLDMLDQDYKFYLAFENSNCKDYITEKFYVNGLGRNVLPIVMGARPEDYERNAPYRSYLHVDDFESAEELAAYLHRLDADDDLYNSYFRWKGTGEFINTYFFCRLCAMLHDDFPFKSYRDVNDWWRGPGTCTGGSWKKKAVTTKRPATTTEGHTP